MNLQEYRLMLQKEDPQSLIGIISTIDAEKFPERAKAVRDEIERRKNNGDSFKLIRSAEARPKWKIQKNWYKINAIIVGMLSAISFYSIFTASDSGFYIDFEALFFAVAGLAGVLLYFWKFRIGHFVLLCWWFPQLADFETKTFKYSLYSGIRFGLNFAFGPLEISTNALAIISFIWLVYFKKFYEKRIEEESAARSSAGR
jgi:hypothetical protein